MIRRRRQPSAAPRSPSVPSRVPGDGRMALEATAGDLQLARPRMPNSLRRVGRRVASEEQKHTIYPPGAPVPVSGVYNVVDRRGNYLGRQVTCHESKPFPPTTGLIALALAFGYVLAYEAAHPHPDEEIPPPPQRGEDVHEPGDTVLISGVYDVVDRHGRDLGYQHACVAGDPFPPTDPDDSRAYGYALRYEAKRLAHNWTVVKERAVEAVEKGDGRG